MFELFEYNIPFRYAFKTGSAEFKNRFGILLHHRENGKDFVAEVSPLPGFSRETFEEVRNTLLMKREWIEIFLKKEISVSSIRDLPEFSALDVPSIQFGLSFLSASILAHRKKQSISELFGKMPVDILRINDVIGHGSTHQMKQEIQASIRRGFKVLKIKAPFPLGDLATLLSSFQEKNPEVLFRLDANQSWPVQNLDSIFAEINNLSIEYIEEPYALTELSQLEEVQSISSFPIALDESVSSLPRLSKALKKFPDLVVIIKPMLLGNIFKIHETIMSNRSTCRQIVVTTSLESKIGRFMSAKTATLVGDKTMRHGLNTGHLLADDLLPDFNTENDKILHLQEDSAVRTFDQINRSYLKKLG